MSKGIETGFITPEKIKLYGASASSCGCPARKFNKTTPCKHMGFCADQEFQKEARDQRIAAAWASELKFFNTRKSSHGTWVCGCLQFEESAPDQPWWVGSCRHINKTKGEHHDH